MRPNRIFRRIKLKTKIVGTTVSAIILTTIVGSGFFYERTKTIIFNNLQKRGMTICENLSHSARYGVLTEDTIILNELVEGVMQAEDVVYVIIQDAQGKTLAVKTAVGLPNMASLKKKALSVRRSQISHTKDRLGNPIYNFSSPIIAKRVSLADIGGIDSELEEEPPIPLRGTVQVGLVLTNVLNRLQDVLRGIIALTVIIIGFGIIFSLGFVRIIMKPIEEMTEAAVRVASGDLSQTVKAESHDEIGQFARQFNTMTLALKKRKEQLNESYKKISMAKEQLELKVKERTAELTVANDQLKKEVIERKRAEKRKDQLLRELENVNQELKDFAYIASHDLKAPLRGISTLAEWLSTDYADKFDQEGREQMKLLLSRVDRMHNLIDGVLQYSRVGRIKENLTQIDLNKLVPNVIDIVAPPENIEVTIENQLPVIECDETRITQVFQNLLSNAIKYIDKPEGKIKIGGVEENDFWKFSISDNGLGIEEKHFDKIFQIFQTLTPRDTSESTGIGLTVVKKIVELYHGNIWVESTPGEGSTFFFTLPKQSQDKGVKNAKLEANIAR